MTEILPIIQQTIENKIIILRGKEVILDRDLAMLYGVTTKRLNEQVKRNKKRFPVDFMFKINKKEKAEVVANCDHLGDLKFSSQLPHAFTEQGIAMLSSVLSSERAIIVNIAIMRAFIKMRQLYFSYKTLAQKIDEIEKEFNKKNKIQGQQIKEIFLNLNKIIKADENKKVKEIGFKSK